MADLSNAASATAPTPVATLITARRPTRSAGAVAYVVKGYPRLSELFIASEIWRLEQLGLTLKLYVLKAADEEALHRVVGETNATPHYLPEGTSLSATTAPRWLLRNGPRFAAPWARVAARHPLGLGRAAMMAAAQSVRARTGWHPKKLYLKELLQAVALADELSRTPSVALLHGHFAHGATTVTWLASAITGIPFSFTGHAKDIYQGTLNPAGLLARKMRAAKFVATCTSANHEHLRSIEPQASIELVYHGLNADFSRLLANAAAPTRPTRPRIVSVGRLVPKKGFDVLIRAVALLAERGVDVEVVIAGEDGSHGPGLRNLVEDHALRSSVSFVGVLSQQELLDLYLGSTLFVLACRVVDDGDRDGIPNVMMEAMATGLPVVSTAISGIPELVVDGVNGLLTEPESPDALADAMLRVLTDPALATRLGDTGRATIAEGFDGERLAHRMNELFADAMAGGSHA
jgi:glycosyltransferase involved in cell wall biosynthesis